jgi:UDP-sugar transporter A1/2/3
MIATRFTASTISRTSVVIGTEIGKIVIAIVAILAEPSAVRSKIFEEWSITNSLKIAALPATLYAVQNLFVQYGYIWLDSMTFNLLNQTKVRLANDTTHHHHHHCTNIPLSQPPHVK